MALPPRRSDSVREVISSEFAALAAAVINVSVGRGLDLHQLLIGQQVLQPFLGTGNLHLLLCHVEALFIQGQGQFHAIFGPGQGSALDGFLDLLVRAGNSILQQLIALKLFLLHLKLGSLDRIARPLQDDLFRLFGQIVGFVHFFELFQFLAVVFQKLIGRISDTYPPNLSHWA